MDYEQAVRYGPPKTRHCCLCAKDYPAYVPEGEWDRGYCPECKAKSEAMQARRDAVLAERRKGK